MSVQDGLAFGERIVFTFGPLGFLGSPTLWYGDTGGLAFLYTLVLHLALAAALFAGARRSYGTVLAFVIALLVASASLIAYETVPFFVFAVWIVAAARRERFTPAWMALAGALVGVELLSKQSTGIEIAAMALVAALAARGRRAVNLAILAASALLALLVGWLAVGEPLGALPAYVHNSARIVSGYAAAMGLEEASANWEYVAAWVAFAFGLIAALQMTATARRRERWGVLCLWIVFCFFEYKEAFVRHDGGHGAIYFVALMGAFLAFAWRPAGRLTGLTMTAALFALAFAAQSVQGVTFATLVDPGANARTAIDQIGEVASASHRRALEAAGRQAVRASLPLDAATFALLRGHTVDVFPYQTALAWAYGLDWDPLPAFQSYFTYTVGIDQLNADALASARAPQRILRTPEVGIDNRVLAFDGGLSTRTMLCRYDELLDRPAWQVLGLGPNRCPAAPVALQTVRADWGQSVPVPAPPTQSSFVFVRIGGVGVQGTERLRALLYKPREREVILGGVAHRLVQETATDGLLLRAPANLDYSPPYAFAPNATSIAVATVGQGPSGGRPIAYSFFAQPVTAGPRPASAGATAVAASRPAASPSASRSLSSARASVSPRR